jgi:acyl dehydratase
MADNAPIRLGERRSVSVVENLTRSQIVQYAGASGDFNPMHTDEIYAKEVCKTPAVYGHGMLTMGVTGKALTDFYGMGRLKKFGGRFRAQVWPGDSLTCFIEVTSVIPEQGMVELSVVTRNQDGKAVFEGSATVLPDGL